MVDNESKTSLITDIYRKNISLMKINNIILVLHTCIILLSSFVIYFSRIYHLGSFPTLLSKLRLYLNSVVNLSIPTGNKFKFLQKLLIQVFTED